MEAQNRRPFTLAIVTPHDPPIEKMSNRAWPGLEGPGHEGYGLQPVQPKLQVSGFSRRGRFRAASKLASGAKAHELNSADVRAEARTLQAKGFKAGLSRSGPRSLLRQRPEAGYLWTMEAQNRRPFTLAFVTPHDRPIEKMSNRAWPGLEGPKLEGYGLQPVQPKLQVSGFSRRGRFRAASKLASGAKAHELNSADVRAEARTLQAKGFKAGLSRFRPRSLLRQRPEAGYLWTMEAQNRRPFTLAIAAPHDPPIEKMSNGAWPVPFKPSASKPG